MKVFGIAGFKNAGKTTLVVDLIREFDRRGLAVATVKHAHHAFDIDHPGKDSHAHREAGAREVIVASARRWAHIVELREAAEPGMQELLSHIGDIDLVLVEGYKHGKHPKLELRRAGQDHPRLAPDDPTVCAVVLSMVSSTVSDTGCAVSDTVDDTVDDTVPGAMGARVPVLRREDVPAIADFICDQLGLGRNPSG